MNIFAICGFLFGSDRIGSTYKRVLITFMNLCFEVSIKYSYSCVKSLLNFCSKTYQIFWLMSHFMVMVLCTAGWGTVSVLRWFLWGFVSVPLIQIRKESNFNDSDELFTSFKKTQTRKITRHLEQWFDVSIM